MNQSKHSAIIQTLAAIEHERWGHWQSYLHSKCIKRFDGSLTIPAHLVKRWERQINTPYADLSPTEQQSDIDQVMKYFDIVKDHFTNANP